MNGIRGHGGGLVSSSTVNEVKYPANCTTRETTFRSHFDLGSNQNQGENVKIGQTTEKIGFSMTKIVIRIGNDTGSRGGEVMISSASTAVPPEGLISAHDLG